MSHYRRSLLYTAAGASLALALSGCASMSDSDDEGMMDDGMGSDMNMSTNADMSPQEMFESMDANGDYMLSEDEAAGDSELMSQWDSLDLNGDGMLNPTEFAEYTAPSMDSMDPMMQ